MKKGFTLIEILLYVAILGLLIGAVSAFLLFTIRSQAKTRQEREVLFEATRAMDSITREIQGADGVYAPASIFETNPGQLSLATGNMPPAGETSTYVDFFQCGTQICQKRESQNPVAITSNSVKVQNLVFYLVNSAGNAPSVQIQLTLATNTVSQRPDYQAVFSLTSSASLR